jgi:hypothetical protein
MMFLLDVGKLLNVVEAIKDLLLSQIIPFLLY